MTLGRLQLRGSDIIVDKKAVPQAVRDLIDRHLGEKSRPIIHVRVDETASVVHDPYAVLEDLYIVNYMTGESISFGHSKTMQDRGTSQIVEMKPGMAIVKVIRFGYGKGGMVFIDVHPESAAGFLPEVSQDLSEEELAVLLATRNLISSARKEVFDKISEFRAIQDKLKSMGLLDKRGAITTKGRNTAESMVRKYMEKDQGLPYKETLRGRLSEKYRL